MADIDVCFWCLRPLNDGEEFHKGEDRMVMRNYVPCKKCEEVFQHGIRLTGVVKEKPLEGMPPICQDAEGSDLYPTGTLFLATDEMVKEMLNEDSEKELLEQVLESKVMLMPEENVQHIIDMVKEADAGQPLTEETLDDTAVMENEKVENKLGIPIV